MRGGKNNCVRKVFGRLQMILFVTVKKGFGKTWVEGNGEQRLLLFEEGLFFSRLTLIERRSSKPYARIPANSSLPKKSLDPS